MIQLKITFFVCRAMMACWIAVCCMGIFDENTDMTMSRWLLQRAVCLAMLAAAMFVCHRWSARHVARTIAKILISLNRNITKTQKI